MSAPPRLTCEEVFQRLDRYLDRALGPEELERVREHLETCEACAGEYRFEETLLGEVREKLRRLQAPPDLMTRISSSLAAAPAPEDD